MAISISGTKVEGIFQKRVNRFVGEVIIHGKLEKVHIPNTGRMRELLIPGARVIVKKVDHRDRKTKYDLLMVYKESTLISIDSKLPNILLEQGFLNKNIKGFEMFHGVKREVTFGNSRFDLSLSGDGVNALIEAKCVTLVKDRNIASFPDAPTDRGRKHVLEMIRAKSMGYRTAVFFIIQRNDGFLFTPNKEMDPLFYEAVVEAIHKGVEFYAFNCEIQPDTVQLREEIEMFL